MNKESLKELRPFLSVLIVIATFLSLVILQMEERRIGYGMLKLGAEHRKVIEQKRVKTMMLAKLTRPQHIERIAESKLTLRKIQSNQIIHLTGSTEASFRGTP